jgi:hypothetical protein
MNQFVAVMVKPIVTIVQQRNLVLILNPLENVNLNPNFVLMIMIVIMDNFAKRNPVIPRMLVLALNVTAI